MALSYRTRQFYKHLFRVILIVVIVVVLVLLCWILWLRRFVIYTPDGARIDLDLPQQWAPGATGQSGNSVTLPDIYFTQTEGVTPPEDNGPLLFSGYYVTVEELQNELDTVLERIQALPIGTPVLLDVKGHWGYYYYSSDLGDTSSNFDISVMDEFFAAVHASGAYTIARLPAFRDYDFALQNHAAGLHNKKDYLWADENNCYWLDPANEKTQKHLIAICQELRNMGFDEVAFTNFSFPPSGNYVYEQDQAQVITDAAAALVTACADDRFAISFITTDHTFPLPEGNCRLYLQDVAAADVQALLQSMDPAILERTVFFTTSNDTRFEACGVIRPLKMAEQA